MSKRLLILRSSYQDFFNLLLIYYTKKNNYANSIHGFNASEKRNTIIIKYQLPLTTSAPFSDIISLIITAALVTTI